MPITGRFVADFADFYAAVQKADVSLKGLETGAGKVGASLNKMTDQFSGRKIIQDATLAAEAVNRIGGATMLTTAEQSRLNAQITEALAKYKALGQEAPKSLTDLANATKQIATNTTNLQAPAAAAGLSFKTLFSSFTAAGLATQLIGKLTAEVSKMVDAGMRLPAIEQGFKRLNSSVGQNSQEMLTSLKTATKGMVTELDLMQSANKALLLGLPVTKQSMGELATAATALGRAMGMDATKSLDDLITALGRSSPMILDNLGLTVKVGEANEVYAKKLNKTVEELTDAEKKTAFYEAAMEAARKKTKELGDQSKTLGEIITTVWTSIRNEVTQGVGDFNVGIGRMLSSWEKFKQAIKGSQGAGLGGAIAAAAAQEAADAEEAIRKARAAGRKDINLAIDIDPLTAFRKELEAIRLAMDKLTPTQRALIRDGEALNKSVKDIAKSLGVSEGAVQGYLDVLKKADADTKKLGTTMEQAAAKGVKAFKDWHETLADLGFDMTILVAKRMQDLGDKSRTVLSDATARTAEWIKIMVKGLPVISGLGDELGKIGEKVAIDFKEVPTRFEAMRENVDMLSAALLNLGRIGGSLGAIFSAIGGAIQTFAMGREAFEKATRDITGRAGLDAGKVVKNLGVATAFFDKNSTATEKWASGIASGYAVASGAAEVWAATADKGGKAAGAMAGAMSGAKAGAAFGPYGVAIGAVAGAVVGLVRNMNNGRKAIKEFADSMDTAAVGTGFDELHEKLQRMGASGEKLWRDLTQGTANGDPKAAAKKIQEIKDALAALDADIQRYGLTWADNLNAQADASKTGNELAKSFTRLTDAGFKVDTVLERMSGNMSQFITDSIKAGTKIPAALQPIIEKLIRTGNLTEAAARAMLGLQADTMPALADIKDAADRYGLTLDQLGPKVQQLDISETAQQIVKDFKLLMLAGADVGTVMTAMKDHVQKLVTAALKAGLELPESMKPLIQQMIDAGLLTDDTGKKLTDMGNLQFAKPLSERFDELIAKLSDLIDALSKVGTAAEEGFGRARGAAEALGRAIPRGSVPGAPEPGTGTPGAPAVPRPEGPGGPPSNSDDDARTRDDAPGTPPGPPGRRNPNPSTADIAAMMASAQMPAFADSQSLGRVLPFPSPALTPAEAALTASPGAGSTTTVHIHVDLDGRQIAEAVVPNLTDVVQSYGAS